MIESLIKPANLVASGYSYLKSSVAGTTEIKGMPVSVSTELTNNCNLSCPHCSSGSGRMLRKKGFMDIDLFKKIMKELRPYLYNVNLYFQGEPMLHPLFFSFIANCLKTNAVVSTNGHYLSGDNSERIVRSGLKKLIISVDGVDQETYSIYRINGNLNTVTEGIKKLTEAKERFKSSLKIEIQFLVNSFNEHQIPQIKELAKSVHAKLRLKSMQIIDKAEIDSWLPSDNRFKRYTIKDGSYVLKSSMPDRCARLWFNPVITWDGKVVPCCFDKDAEHIMGDLNQDSFREIWDGPKYRVFRKSILSGRQTVEICRNCTSGLAGVNY
jgi:radical SAM protein with 4Fe4S-binding SPASM domain